MANARLLFVLFLLLPLVIQAAQIEYSDAQSSGVETRISESQRIERLARQWQVSSEAWTRYEEIMKGEGRYHWKDVDPIVVLGIYAKDDTERKRYARLAAAKEHQRQTRFIQFNQAYVEEFDHLYGQQPIMDLAQFYERYRQSDVSVAIRDASTSATPESTIGDRFVLFTNTECAGCDDWFRKIRDQKSLGTTIDLYFINDDKQAIGRWAKDMAIDPSELDDGAITLNLDTGLYNQYGRPALPAAYYFDDSRQSVQRIKDEALP